MASRLLTVSTLSSNILSPQRRTPVNKDFQFPISSIVVVTSFDHCNSVFVEPCEGCGHPWSDYILTSGRSSIYF